MRESPDAAIHGETGKTYKDSHQTWRQKSCSPTAEPRIAFVMQDVPGFSGLCSNECSMTGRNPQLYEKIYAFFMASEAGYQVSANRTVHAIGPVRDHATSPNGKPLFKYLVFGARHRPHQVPGVHGQA